MSLKHRSANAFIFTLSIDVSKHCHETDWNILQQTPVTDYESQWLNR